MKTKFLRLLSLPALLAFLMLDGRFSSAVAQGTAFTYQGQLQNNGSPANGSLDLTFTLYDASSGGVAVAEPVTNSAIAVTNGIFSTLVDFGPDVFTGASNWLAIAVRTNDTGSFTPLAPRQQLTPAPYAIFAEGTSNLLGTLPVAQLSGTVPLAQLPAAVVTNSEASVTLSNVTLTGILNLPSVGTINAGGSSLLYADGAQDFYAGPGAGSVAISASDSTGIGYGSLSSNSNGVNNTAIGYLSLNNNTNGSFNVASGGRALFDNTSGNNNTAYGRRALEANVNGSDNTADGFEALSGNPGGSNNIALGYLAGSAFGNYENSNIDIGNPGVGGDNNIIRIGSGQTSTFIAGVINGNGGGLTNLNASQLSAQVVTNGESNVSLGSLTLGGSLDLPYPISFNTELALGFGYYSFLYAGNNNLYLGTRTGNGDNGSENTGIGGNMLQQVTGSRNTAVGFEALDMNTTGNNNVAVGNFALLFNTNGSANVAIGVSAMGNSTNDIDIVAVGYQALQSDAAGAGGGFYFGSGANTAVGFQALESDTSGGANTAGGFLALVADTSGSYNTAFGVEALYDNTTGINNTAVGNFALFGNTGGNNNVAVGLSALGNCTNDYDLVAIGFQALQNENYHYTGGPGTISGFGENTAIGYYALQADSLGYANTAVGSRALALNQNGYFGTAIGDNALKNNLTGYQNTAIGYNTLTENETGNNNIALGYGAGENLSSGSGNIYIGNQGNLSESGVIRIGDTQTQTYLVGTVNCGPISSSGNIVSASSSTGPATCSSITITGGADLAEPFSISTAGQAVSEGEVVVIDDTNPGQLKLTDRPYDTRVAGVVSGANGIHPGIQMHQQGLLGGGRNVALTGRVYVQADTSNGAINPGDLLTTSSTPGHAMKVTDHARAAGAILGKAMSRLSEGNGMVLVLVTLQ
jgi:hypothetical protein